MGIGPYDELAIANRTLQMKIDACDSYHAKVLQAFSDAYAIAMRYATPEERAQLEELRRRVL